MKVFNKRRSRSVEFQLNHKRFNATFKTFKLEEFTKSQTAIRKGINNEARWRY